MKCSATSEKKWKELCRQESLGRFMKGHLEGWMGKAGRHLRWGTAHAKAQSMIFHGASVAKTWVSAHYIGDGLF